MASPPAIRVVRAAAATLGEQATRPPGWSTDWLGIAFERDGIEVEWVASESTHHLTVQRSSALIAALGRHDSPMTEPVGEIAGVPAYRLPGELREENQAAVEWLVRGDGEAWVRRLALGPEDALESFGGYVHIRMASSAADPDAEVHRFLRVVDSLSGLPRALSGSHKESVRPTGLPAPVADALMRYLPVCETDDAVRERVLNGLDSLRLRELVVDVSPLLPNIDAILDDIVAYVDDHEQAADLEPRLHALAQATIEAGQLLGRAGPDREDIDWAGRA